MQILLMFLSEMTLFNGCVERWLNACVSFDLDNLA